jgi:phage-related holin
MKELLEVLKNNLQELTAAAALKGTLAAACAWFLEVAGYPETAALSLLYLLLADLGLGAVRAWMQRTFRGKRLVSGAFKFFRYWIAIALFVVADKALEKAITGFDVNLSNFFIAYLALNELGSCMEHLAFFGLPMPEAVKERLHKYREALAGGNN